jgi:4-oxalocrotonate tautomerase
MPIITVEGPSIKDMDRKRTFVAKLTNAAVEAFAFPKEKIVILLRETRPDNVGVGGELVSDTRKSGKPE